MGMDSGEEGLIRPAVVAHGSHIGSSEESYESGQLSQETLGPPKAAVVAPLVDMPCSSGPGFTSAGTDPSEKEEESVLVSRTSTDRCSGVGRPLPSLGSTCVESSVKESGRVATRDGFISLGHTVEDRPASYNGLDHGCDPLCGATNDRLHGQTPEK